MAQLIVRHRVKDFEAWKSIFDKSETIRKAYGEVKFQIFRCSGDPNDISILFEWKDPKKLMKYSQTEELRGAMNLAGVEGEPALYLLNEDLQS